MRQMSALFQKEQRVKAIEQPAVHPFESGSQPLTIGGAGEADDEDDQPGDNSEPGKTREKGNAKGRAGHPARENGVREKHTGQTKRNSQNGTAFKKPQPFPSELGP